MSLAQGETEVFPKTGKSFDPAEIPKAIKDAGFSAPEVVATVDGSLRRGKEFLELEVPGLKHVFVLAGGAKEEALKQRAHLIGKKLLITGKLHPSHGGLPPGLSVEDFQPAP